MDAPRRTRSEENLRVDPDDSIRAHRALIVRTCQYAGLSAADADDVAQDLCEWLIRTGVPVAAVTAAWLKGAVRNYVLRFRRRSSCRRAREGRPLDSTPEPESQPILPILESNELLDQVAAVLPKTERRMLALIRQGYTIADAGRKLGIPAGSRDFYKGRLVAYARRELQRRRRIPVTRNGK